MLKLFIINHENIFKLFWNFVFRLKFYLQQFSPQWKFQKLVLTPLFSPPPLILKNFSSPQILLSSKIQFPPLTKEGGTAMSQQPQNTVDDTESTILGITESCGSVYGLMNYFKPAFHLHACWNHLKNSGFLMSSGHMGIKWWLEVSW